MYVFAHDTIIMTLILVMAKFSAMITTGLKIIKLEVIMQELAVALMSQYQHASQSLVFRKLKRFVSCRTCALRK